MIKLRFSKPKYSTHCDGAITVCTYQCEVVNTETSTTLATFTVSGKAYQSDTDEDDAHLGIMIADSRAKATAYATARDIMTPEEIAKMERVVNIYSQYLKHYKKMQFLKKAEDKHLNWILHESKH